MKVDDRFHCGVCGGTAFTRYRVLWQELIDEWELLPEEAEYIDRQQGEICNGCGSNLRSIALANALRAFLDTQATLGEAAGSALTKNVSILEINEAGMLTPVLRRFGRYVFGAYPEVDMHALPYNDGTFDLVVHSDTLEHVPFPIHALAECRRVLRPGGALCFTVPLVVGRLSRSRDGLPPSYHGRGESRSQDMAVQTEYGADAWTHLMESGFSEVSIHPVEYPVAVSFLARNGRSG